VWPAPVLDTSAASVAALVERAHMALAAGQKAALLMGGNP
jgi:hypothetical protein